MSTRFASLYSLSILLLISAACQQQAPPPAPADTHDADVKAINDTEAAWVAAFGTKDAGKAASFYADDASVLIPNQPIAKGRENIEAIFKPMLDDPNFKLEFSAARTDVAKSAELGYSQGTYTWTFSNPKTKKPMEDKGKYLTVFKKQADGSWKAVEDTFMSDLPLPKAKLPRPAALCSPASGGGDEKRVMEPVVRPLRGHGQWRSVAPHTGQTTPCARPPEGVSVATCGHFLSRGGVNDD